MVHFKSYETTGRSSRVRFSNASLKDILRNALGDYVIVQMS